MAYSKTPSGEHPSRTIIKTMQSGSTSGIYPRLLLLCGKEDFLVEWSVSFLKSGLVDPACTALDYAVFSEDGIDADSIIQTCDTLPLMSLRKLVVVKDCDIFTAQQPRDMDSEDIEKLISYLPRIPETTMLVFTCGKPNKTKAVYKAVSKLGIVYDFYPLDDATLGGWMAKRFAAAGKTASRRDMTDFAKICGYGDDERAYTLYNLENDLKKIFALYDKEELSLNDMLLAAQGQAEVNAFRLLDRAFGGRKGEAFEILNSNIDSKSPSKEAGVVLSFLGLIISQLEIMTEGKERQEEGQSYHDIIKDMGVNEYRFKKAMASCKDKTASQLRTALDRAYQTEKDMKTGNTDGRLGLELFIGNI